MNRFAKDPSVSVLCMDDLGSVSWCGAVRVVMCVPLQVMYALCSVTLDPLT